MRRLALALALLAALPSPGRAADDWEVKRSPFDKQLVARLKQQLDKNPNDAYALKKLTELYRRYRTLDALAAELGSPTVLGHLARERGQLDVAALRYREALAKRPDLTVELALADVLVRLQREDEATALLDRTLERITGSGDREARARLLRLLIARLTGPTAAADALARATTYLRQLVALAPNDDELRRELAELHARQHQYREAARQLDTVIAHLGKDPGKQAALLLELGSFEEADDSDARAVEMYQRAFASVPRGHYLRREALEKVVAVKRKHDELRTQAGTWERDWPEAQRDFVEWDLLARLYDETGDSPRAQECFRRALAADPHALEARRRLIALYEREGRDADVVAEYRRLIAAAPGEPRFRLELAERLRKTPGGEKEALSLCERIAGETRDPSVHSSLAELYTRWGLTDRALAERERLVRLEPDDETHLVNLGELYFQRGQREKAFEVWRRLLSRGGNRTQAMARLAEVYAEHNLNGDSLDLYQKAAKLAPTDGAIQRGLAAALERLRRDPEAEAVWLELFDRAVTAGKRAEALELRQHLVSVVARQGRLPSAVRQYRQRFDQATDPQVTAGYGLLTADAALKLGRLVEADAVLHALAGRAKDDETRAEAFIGLAQVCRARHQVKEQIAALEKAAELAPARARELYAQIASLSLELYRDNDALTYAQKAIALGPADAQAQLRLAEVLEKRDQIDPAVAAYQRALELDDRQWKVRFVLARLQLRRGEHAQAARLYREVIRRAPDEELVVDAARRAIDLEEYLGTLGELERELEPLAYAHPEKRVYRNLLIDLYQRHAGPLVQAAREGGSPAELARIGEHALGPLLEVLVDGELTQQRTAVALLGELRNPGAAAPLLRLAQPLYQKAPGATAARPRKNPKLRDLKDPFAGDSPPDAPRLVDARPVDLRVDAALAGARLAGEKDVPALHALAGDREKHVRLAALYGLMRVGKAAAVPVFLRELAGGTPEAQALACGGLAMSPSVASKRALPEIIKIVGDVARPELARAACAFALGVLAGDKPAAARTALEATLLEGSGRLQARAAWALGVLGGRPSAESLLAAVFVKSDEVRFAAAAALGRPAGVEVKVAWPEPKRTVDGLDVSAWVAALRESAPPEATVAALGRELELPLADALADALSRHRDLQLRTLADLDQRGGGLSLGPLGGEAPAEVAARLLPSLEKLAASQDPLVRARAAQVLAKIPGAAARVLALAADGAPRVRRAALDALSRARAAAGTNAHEHDAAIDAAIRRALESTDWRERRAAALALAESGSASRSSHGGGAGGDPGRGGVHAQLAALLDDPSGFVREAAALALGTSGAAGEPPLARHLDDESPEVRHAVASALGDTGAAAARAPLARLSSDTDPAVRAAAVAALARLSRD